MKKIIIIAGMLILICSCKDNPAESTPNFNEVFYQRFNGMSIMLGGKQDNSIYNACVSDSSFLVLNNDNTFHLRIIGQKEQTGEKFRVEQKGTFSISKLSKYEWGLWSGKIEFYPSDASAWGGNFEYTYIKELPGKRYLLIKMWVFIDIGWNYKISPQRFYPDYNASSGC